jgi:hypothetical protein
MLSLLHGVSSATCGASELHTFQAFVSVVLIDEDIVCSAVSARPSTSGGCGARAQLTALVLTRRQRGRREGEALHLCRLGQHWHAVVLYNSAAGVDGLRSRGWRRSAKWTRYWREPANCTARLTCAKSGPLAADGCSKNRRGSKKAQLEAAVRSPKAANVLSYSGSEISAAPGNVRIYGRSRHIGT